MPFIELKGLNDAKEQVPVPEGEYNIRVFNAEDALSKKGKEKGRTEPDMVRIGIAIDSDEHPDAEPLTEFINLPQADDETGTKAMKLRNAKRLLHAFGIDMDDGFDTDDLIDAKAKVQVTQDTLDDGRVVNRIRWPRVPNEPAEKPRGGKPVRRR